ncbi:MAG TPA: nitrilase family protein [Spirochaetia bacterium]|nr:nitrilase family protein [Spirochaetia bacterium]
MHRIRCASVQFQHKAGDKEFNLSRIGDFVDQASAAHVDLITFPEMCITGYWHVRSLTRPEILTLSEAIPDGASSQRLIELAKRSGMTIGAGLIERDETGTLYNSYLIAMPDGSHRVHRKIHCFISQFMESGSEFTVFDIPQGARVGVLTCYDNNIIENVRATALLGAEILLAPHQTGGCNTASPKGMKLIDVRLWDERRQNPEAIESAFKGANGRGWLMHWLPSRAHDNGLFLVFSNGVGVDDGEVRTGNAMILDPYGDILTETWRAEDAMVVADLDPELLRLSTGSRWIRSRRPELYQSLTVPTGREEDTRKVRFESAE